MSSRISQKSPEDYSYDDDFEDDESSGIQSDLRVRRKSISSSSSLSNSKQNIIPKLSSHSQRENEKEERSIFNYNKGNEREEYSSLSSAKSSQKPVSISDSQKYEFAVQPKSRIFPSPSGRSIKSSGKNKIVSWIQKGKWTLGENIGKGSFGTVFQCMNNKGNFFAVKRIEMNSTRRESVDDLVREIDLMRGISHPNIVEYIGASVDEKNFFLYIFQEWVSGGSVAHLLKRFGPFKEGVVLNYTEQILKGLSYLHENGIVHRDIKGGNVLVASSGVVKLADFGASTKLDLGGTQELKNIKGTPYFMAPEVLANSLYGRKGDIWAVGCTMVQMLTGEPPWKDRQLSGIVQLHLLIANWAGGPPPISVPLEANGKIDTCLKLCFVKNPTARPSAVELLNLDIFSNADDDDDELSGSISAFSSPENTLNFRTRSRSISRSTDGEASLANSGILSGLRDKMNRVVASCTSPASQLPSPARIGNSSFSPKTPKVNTLFGQNGNNYNYGNNTNNTNNVNNVYSNQGRKTNELSPDVFQEGSNNNNNNNNNNNVNLTSAPSPFNKNNPFGRNRASSSNDSNRSSPTKEDQILPGFSNFNMDELCEPKEFVQLDNPFSTRANQQRNTNSSSLIPSISSNNSVNNSNSSINFSRGKNSNGKHTPIPECDEDIESDQSRKNLNYQQQIQKSNSQKNNLQTQNQNSISTSEKSITSSCGSGKSGGSSPRYLSKAPSMISTNNLSLLPSNLSQIPSPSPEARSINSSREKRVRNISNNSTKIPSPVKRFSPNSTSNSNSNSPRNEQLIPPSSFSPMFSHRSQSKHNSSSNLSNQNNFSNDQFKNQLPRSAPSALGSSSSNYNNSSNDSLNSFSNNFSNTSLQNEGKVKSLLEFDNRLISPSRVDPIKVNNISNTSNNSSIRNSTGISSLSTNNRSIATNNTRSKSVNPSEVKMKQRASTADATMVSSASEPQINNRMSNNKNINLNNSLNSKDSSNNNNRISIMSFLSPQTSKRKTNSSDKLVPIRQSSAQSSQSNNNSNKSIIANNFDDNLDQTQTQWRCLKCSQNNTNPTHCIQCATVRGSTGKRDNSAIILRK